MKNAVSLILLRRLRTLLGNRIDVDNCDLTDCNRWIQELEGGAAPAGLGVVGIAVPAKKGRRPRRKTAAKAPRTAPKRKMSPATRRKMSKLAKARWAKAKANGSTTLKG